MGQFDDLGAIPAENNFAPVRMQDFSDLGAVAAEALPEPNMGPAHKVAMGHIAEAQQPSETGEKKELSFKDAWLAGWQGSVTGLMTHGGLPDKVLPEHADTISKILSYAGSAAGDAPWMAIGNVGGRIAGAAAGEAVAGPAGAAVGSVAGARAGTLALPAAMRQVLVDHYKKGDIASFKDFYERTSATMLQALKGGTIGLATGYAGDAIGGVMTNASPMTKLGAVTLGEGLTMATTGAALEGRAPNKDDFENTAIMMATMYGVGVVSKPLANAIVNRTQNKLMDTYAQTGLHPAEVAELVKDPVLRQQMLSDDPNVPQSLKPAVDGNAPKYNEIRINPELQDLKADGVSTATENEPASKIMVEAPEAVPEEKPGEPVKRSDAVNNVLSRIGEQADAPKDPLTFDKMYRAIIDQYDPIKQLTKATLGEEAIGTKEDPYGLIRSFKGVGRKADEIIENGPRDFETLKKTGTPGLTDIFEEADDLKELRAYRMAKHYQALRKAGIETGADDAEDVKADKAVVKELGPKYEAVNKKITQFKNDNIDYLVDSGVLAKDVGETIKNKWVDHVAMNRVFSADEIADQNKAFFGGSNTTPSNPIKGIKGSDRDIVDPLQSDLVNTHKMVIAAEKNRVATALADAIDSANESGDKMWGNKAKTPVKGIELGGDEVAKILKDQGFDPNDAEDLGKASTIFRAKQTPLADDQIAVFRDGKREVYENVPPELVKAVRGMDAQSAGLLVKALAGPSKLLRTGMLNSPAFAIRHFFRQEIMAAALSKDAHLPVYETVKGLTGMMGEDFGDWIMHGGGSDSITAIDENYLKSKIYDLNDETGFLDKSWNKVTNYGQFVKHGIELTDEARTFQKFQNRKAAGLDPWQAQFQARDTGIDVSRTGANMTAYAALDPFQNIRIQGLDLIARRLKENPEQVIPRLIGTITVPSVALWAANHDKQWYKDLTPQDRDTNWHFAVGDPDNGGHIIRVPKPFEPGVVFGAIPERLLDAYKDQRPDAWKDSMKTITDSIMPGYVPTFAQPVLEQWANKNYLTDSPLIPGHLEGIEPKHQVKDYTSDVAKTIATGFRQLPYFDSTPGSLGSPIVVDQYLKDWTGGVGQLMISTADAALEKQFGKDSRSAADLLGVDYNHNPPEKVWADNPFLRSFVLRYPSTNTRAIGEFFDKFKEIDTRMKTIQNRMKAGDMVGYEEQVQEAMSRGEMMKLSGMKQTVSDQMALIQKITAIDGMDAHEKRQQIDDLARGVNAFALEANEGIRELEAEMKAVGKNAQAGN